MSIRKKRHLIAGTIIGGLLLAATTQTGNSFALSDTSSPSTSGAPSTSQQTTTTIPDGATPSGDSSSTTPTTPTDSAASGSTATQSANTTAGVTTSANDPSSTSSPTDPSSSDPATNTTSNTATAANTVNSNANTGDASVKHTTDGGNATSGDASAGTTLINNIASTSNLNSGTLQTFNYNIDGTQNGNVVINPNDIVTTSTNGSTTPADCLPGTTTADNTATINNLVNLLAQTGNAKVSDNGVGGNATSGDATTEANIINTIQDLVSDQGAFLGVINVNGDLNGNIELPASVISSLLTPTSSDSAAGSSTATNNTNVNNNVTLTAITGNAAVTNNGTGGNATSGNASTILQSCNLINSNIVGGNLLLVFVNVMGNWYGALLSEPAGDTTATLGGGITQDTVSPTQQTTAINNATINNDVNLTSISGNATVANNGVGGNATTGNATAIADVTNILGSQINLSGWLGILVINVFGTWDGSLMIQPTSITNPTISSNDSNHIQTSARHTDPVDLGNGSGYYIVNPPQSFDEGQFDLASVQIPSVNTTIASSILGSGVRQTAVKTDHGTQSVKRIAVDYILAGIGLAFAITGGASRFFTNRRDNL